MITELELKVQQLSKEAGLTSSTHSKLIQEKVQNELLLELLTMFLHVQGVLETQCTRLQGNLEEAQDRLVS